MAPQNLTGPRSGATNPPAIHREARPLIFGGFWRSARVRPKWQRRPAAEFHQAPGRLIPCRSDRLAPATRATVNSAAAPFSERTG